MVRPRWWAGALIGCGLASLAATACTGSGGDASGPRSMVVLDASTGKERWSVPRDDSSDGWARPGLGSGLAVASPIRCGLGEDHGTPHLVAFDLGSGERKWDRKGFGFASTETMVWQQSPTVDVAASGVVVATGGRLGAPTPGLDSETGELRWQIELPEKYLGASETLVFTTSVDAEPRNTLNAFDRRTGRRRWSFPVTAETLHTTFDVVAGNQSTIVVASGPYNVRSGPDPIGPTTFLVLDADTGRERTRFLSADPAINFSDFAIVDGALVYAENGDALARDLTTGQVQWSRHATFPRPAQDGGVPWMRIELSADHSTVFTSGERGIAEVLDARTGAVLWNASDRFLRAAEGRDAVFQDGDQQLESVAARSGRPRWERGVHTVLRTGGGVPTNVGVDDSSVVLSATCDDG